MSSTGSDDDYQIEEEKISTITRQVPLPGGRTTRHGSVVQPTRGGTPSMGPTSIAPPRRRISTTPADSVSRAPPERALDDDFSTSYPARPVTVPPRRPRAPISESPSAIHLKRSTFVPTAPSSKSSFVPPLSNSVLLRDTLKLPTRSTRAFASRIKHSLVSIPENAAASSNAVPTNVGARTKARRPAPPRGGASTIAATAKTVRLSVIPVGLSQQESEDPSRTLSFAPKRLLDIENGKSIVVTRQQFLPSGKYQELDETGALVVNARATAPIAQEDQLFFEERGPSLQDLIVQGSVRNFKVNSEVGILGGAWRGVLKRLLLLSYDEVNGLRLSRNLQLFMPFQTGYETYILGQLVEAMDNNRKTDIKYVLGVAFQNRNVSRIVVQQVRARYDFIWHTSTAITWNRVFDLWGQVPVVGITSFPPSENFTSTRNHALASMFRVILGEGNWLTRVFTRGREGLVTDNPKNTAQNLAAEANGFELANRNQYGTYIGRRETNKFRASHRLPVDESLVRTFVANPASTTLNNGVVHVLRQISRHWHNMLYQFSGNFAHQRMEQLNPFETLRFHVPVLLMTLSTLRGRNKWDSKVLGPFIRKLQELKPSMTGDAARYLVTELKENIIVPVCAGVAAVVDPFMSWASAIREAVDGIEEEAKLVYEIVTSVEVGIRLGHDLITQAEWKIPRDGVLKDAIIKHIKGLPVPVKVNERRIRAALTLVTPRDKRTLIELVKNGHQSSKPAQLLLGRTKTLLQRELRREHLNEMIRNVSVGQDVTEFEHDDWYWIQDGEKSEVYIYDAKVTGRDMHRFVHVDSIHGDNKVEKFVSLTDGAYKFKAYIPVAEAITRAQRAFMNIELDHGKKFTFAAFMEFSYLRIALRRLLVISQVFCEALDNARINVLAEIQRSNQAQISIRDCEVGKEYYKYNHLLKAFEPFVCDKEYTEDDPEWETLGRTRIVKYPPQSVIVVGGGPTGLTTVLHCTENVLISGGIMKLYEARDAFSKGGATFERSQIVRLDPRWIAMLRYYLGTGFEDVYIPASGETDSQLGNTLPTQGFVEITIKDLENMLHVEISKMWSKGLIQVYADAKSNFDVDANALTKLGQHLSVNDVILRKFDENGNPSSTYHSWKVADLIYPVPLSAGECRAGEEYGIYLRSEDAVLPYKLDAIDLTSDKFTFKPVKEGQETIIASSSSLPTIYDKSVKRHAEAHTVILECVKKGSRGGYVQNSLSMARVRKEKFTLDVGHTHVVEAIGKPHGSKVHFSLATYEPYGVCCIQGLKVSMGMHNFGEKRWGNGILDDFRSQNDRNTRIIGDFTKMVRSAPVAQFMYDAITDKKDKNWQVHFVRVVEESPFPTFNELNPILPTIQAACQDLATRAHTFRRQTLQTRFFETGDNYYLGMEFTREYDAWKNALASQIVAPLLVVAKDSEAKKNVDRFRGLLMHHIDRLWYDGVLETIRKGDVYSPGARHRVPRLYLTNSYFEVKLGTLPVGESFRLSDKEKAKEKYEVVIKDGTSIVVRNVEGYISKMNASVKVKREGNLTRGPDGNSESKVALATFPVGFYVNFRTMRLSDLSKGYVFAFIGDEQATPHFMRYSGLTGACINSMLFNNFIKQAVQGGSFIDRFRLYSVETNWSNGEVVQRGTTSNYGDGFLRPGFPIAHGLDYLHSKIIEYRESDQDVENILSRDWLVKLAASMVPRGMELNEDFIGALYQQVQHEVFEKFVRDVKSDPSMRIDGLENILREQYKSIAEQRSAGDYDSFWNDFIIDLPVDGETKVTLSDPHIYVARRLEQTCDQIIEFAVKAHMNNERVSSQLFNQPKSVDSIVDDFAVEAQAFANALARSAAFSSGALAFSLLGTSVGDIFSALVSANNITIAFGTMTEVSRYKIRNEEARVIFMDEKMLAVMKGVFAAMDSHTRAEYPIEQNPFVEHLENQIKRFDENTEYYDYPEPTEFKAAYQQLLKNVNDPTAIREFQKLLTTKFLVDTYHVNSFLQDDLVHVYKTCEDMHFLLTQKINRSANDAQAKKLFNRLRRFRVKLEPTLQRGPTRWGFIKQRRIFQWDCIVVFKYLFGLLCFSTRCVSLPGIPIATETRGLLKQIRYVSSLNNGVILRREIRDVEALFWATRESDIASLIFTSAFLVFLAAIFFTFARIVDAIVDSEGSGILIDAAFWANLLSTTGAVLGTFHFLRKLFLLVGLFFTLSGKIRTAAISDDRERLVQVRRVTRTQIVLTMMRLISVLAASVALPWSVAENAFGDKIGTPEDLPEYIGLGAIGMAILSTLYFFLVEYVVRYNLDPKLGEYVCESFREEIEKMYTVLENPLQDNISTKQVQERETWEYVAREFLHKYRFDTVFAADRFGAILQYIQSGMDPRS